MAAPISKTEIQQLPVHPYDSIRDHMQTGDLVFCSGSYFFRTQSSSSRGRCGAMSA